MGGLGNGTYNASKGVNPHPIIKGSLMGWGPQLTVLMRVTVTQICGGDGTPQGTGKPENKQSYPKLGSWEYYLRHDRNVLPVSTVTGDAK